eukprot:TRINITY_DN4274_c0_g1_i1.p1 TRINITY_DN4274_c0_g1~~TRINITY_DN4274_c0_g1_i1.p1  ORF type:complete len:175 (+),score=30.23 TRINITY_DN4274_c0_g1_i1:51-527(+)
MNGFLSFGIRKVASQVGARATRSGLFSRQTVGTTVSSPIVTVEAEAQKRWASKAAGGTTKNNRDSNPKYLGLKKGQGQLVQTGNILVRQRGTKFHAGAGVVLGRDHTLSAKVPGYVHFLRTRAPKGRQIQGRPWRVRKFVAVLPEKPAGLAYVRQDIR